MDTIKDVAKLAKEINRLDLHEKVVDLMQQVMELTEEKGQLRSRVTELEQRLKQRDEMQFDSATGTYRQQAGDGSCEGPFCPKCWHGRKDVVPMVPVEGENARQCVACGQWDKAPKSKKSVGAFQTVRIDHG